MLNRRIASRLAAAIVAAAFIPLVAAAQALPDAKTLMDKHNAAVGGRAALEKYASVRMNGTISMAAMGLEATIEILRAKPNKYFQKVTVAGVGEVTQGFDGKVAWGMNPMAGAQVVDGEALEAAKVNADFFANFQDANAYSKSETVSLEDFEGRKCYKVSVTRGDRQGTEYFDATTGLLAGISGSTPTPQGNIESTTIYAEYGDYGGLKLPKRIEQRSSVGNTSIAFTTIEFDKVEATAFDLPAAVKALVKP